MSNYTYTDETYWRKEHALWVIEINITSRATYYPLLYRLSKGNIIGKKTDSPPTSKILIEMINDKIISLRQDIKDLYELRKQVKDDE